MQSLSTLGSAQFDDYWAACVPDCREGSRLPYGPIKPYLTVPQPTLGLVQGVAQIGDSSSVQLPPLAGHVGFRLPHSGTLAFAGLLHTCRLAQFMYMGLKKVVCTGSRPRLSGRTRTPLLVPSQGNIAERQVDVNRTPTASASPLDSNSDLTEIPQIDCHFVSRYFKTTSSETL
jgi:hypothetical protein